ncbi:MAG: MMPL family transporter [Pseudomonadales bacterium]|nr:MMPL family transporter [Pseudomonadales bacterium]
MGREKGKSVIKQFAQHRVAANLLMIMMIMAGLWAVRTMPTMLDPPATLPTVMIDVTWIGAAAEDIESLVTTPIEQQLRTINDLSELSSRTINGSTHVNVTFNFDADMTLALDEVKQRVANIRNLPAAIEPPVIRRAIDTEPVTVLLISTEGQLADLIPLARTIEKDLLRRGIEGIYYDGLPTEEIALLVGGGDLQALGLTLDEISHEVARLSQNVPAGAVGRGHSARQLRSLDQERDPLGFEDLQIERNGQLIRLKDFAEVVRRPQRGQPLLTTEGNPAIEMMLWRATNADAYRAEQLVKSWLSEIQPTLPQGVKIEEIASIWRLLGTQLSMIGKNALSGILLVLGVLFVFLQARPAFWVAIGIPVSFMLGLALFYTGFGYGISIISLIGFIMALGIVVDDAIVVGEDIVTHHEQGMSPEDAAVAGAKRMWVPVLTSSLTTMAAFIPLLIIGGIMGEAILALPTVLLCVIVASLIECFWVLPNHLKTSLTKTASQGVAPWRTRFEDRFTKFRDERFQPLVRLALDHPGTTLLSACAGMMVAVSLVASQHVGINFVTGFDFESLETNVEFSSAATDQQRYDFMLHLEETLDTTDSESGNANILGSVTKYNRATFDQDRWSGEQYAALGAQYAFEEDRNLAPKDFAQQWRDRVTRPSYVEQFTLGVEGGANGGRPDITLILRGNSVDQLKQGSEDLSATLASYPGVSNVTDNLPYGREQIIFELTPRGRSLGLTSDAIGRQLRAAYSGSRVQIFNEQDNELEVRVMLPDQERNSLGALNKFPIRTAAGTFVPLASVAVLYNRRGIDVIRHSNNQLAVAVSATIDPEVNNALAVVSDVEANHLPDILSRNDLTFGLGGQSLQDQILIDTMTLGGILTLILIYLILTWVFSSYIWPLAIMMAIPFGFTGAVVGHWLTGWDVGAMSMLAFFSLTGIVVNDSIVLISFLRRHVDSGMAVKEALLLATQSRFRAVILTSLTTVAGLMPLMFVTSSLSMYTAPIAVTICFGLSFATLLVLIVIPALVLLLENMKLNLTRLIRRFNAKGNQDEPSFTHPRNA